MKITWHGTGLNEVGLDDQNMTRIKIDAKYFRPTEVNLLIGDYSKASLKLNWHPQYTIQDIISEMMDSDLASDRSI